MEEGIQYYKELLTTFQDLKSSEFWNESLQGYWNEYQIKNYGKTRVDYNNKESDIGEDNNDDEEYWKRRLEKPDMNYSVRQFINEVRQKSYIVWDMLH